MTERKRNKDANKSNRDLLWLGLIRKS